MNQRPTSRQARFNNNLDHNVQKQGGDPLKSTDHNIQALGATRKWQALDAARKCPALGATRKCRALGAARKCWAPGVAAWELILGHREDGHRESQVTVPDNATARGCLIYMIPRHREDGH